MGCEYKKATCTYNVHTYVAKQNVIYDESYYLALPKNAIQEKSQVKT